MSSIDIDENSTFAKLLRAQGHVTNQVFNFMNSMSLKCAVQLGIPDIIHTHAKPMTLPQLVTALKIHPSKSHCVYRLLNILCHSGFVSKEPIRDTGSNDNEGYVLTDASRLLLSDNPFNMSPFVLAMLDPIAVNPCHNLSRWFQISSPTTSFEISHGVPVWDYCSRDPKFNDLFNEGMACEARFVSSVLIRKAKAAFEGLNSLVDVGGGTGTVAMALANAFPHLTCTVFDLPHVVANLQDQENLKYVAGNMFEFIPPADAVLLKAILHDWSDDNCVKILKKCKDAIKERKRGKVMIIEVVIGNSKSEDEEEESTETKLLMDMMMMVAVTGQERNEKEWGKLFSDAGFSGHKIGSILGLRSLIEVYP